MQFSNLATITCVLLSSSGSAAPQAPWATTATVQLSNDKTGASVDVVVPVDGQKYAVQELWGNTAVASEGIVSASSTQLVTFEQTTVCTLTEEPLLQVTLDAKTTWASLGPVVDLCAAYVSCQCDLEW
ncbi:hypothetical protein N7495_008766 [Penicillium taxi]|uniref:uncharacterized protein n=1 Tax=Penicillium taxi TaxID=168475 RepID=UPI00254594EF|nr:uncharacterized protein N7495_008766 [Penicillium taxi]KAJ5888725.1 hypothetical protein N7495_008766 [Penicillium taxi]